MFARRNIGAVAEKSVFSSKSGCQVSRSGLIQIRKPWARFSTAALSSSGPVNEQRLIALGILHKHRFDKSFIAHQQRKDLLHIIRSITMREIRFVRPPDERKTSSISRSIVLPRHGLRKQYLLEFSEFSSGNQRVRIATHCFLLEMLKKMVVTCSRDSLRDSLLRRKIVLQTSVAIYSTCILGSGNPDSSQTTK